MQDFIGQTIGRYHIIEKLGMGGMAVVFKAYDTNLDIDVAIKFVRTERLAPDVVDKAQKRFKVEAQKTAKLMHANIVPVIDYGDFKGVPFLVMRYIPGGKTLKNILGKPIPWIDAIKFVLPIAQALDFAHKNQIVHRDVKPSNILVTEDDSLMLTDFGIAKVIEDGETMDGLTTAGMAIGTPEYMAPEQWEGKKVDGRADIYALGVVLYEMITGRPPFKADTVPATMVQVLRDPLPRPNLYTPDLPDGVEKVIIKALAKNPEDRYRNMSELVTSIINLQTIGNIKSDKGLFTNSVNHKVISEVLNEPQTFGNSGVRIKSLFWGSAFILLLILFLSFLFRKTISENTLHTNSTKIVTQSINVFASELPLQANETGEGVTIQSVEFILELSIKCANNRLTSVAFSPDSRFIVVGSDSGEICVVSVEDNKLLLKKNLNSGIITTVSFNINSDKILAGTAKGKLIYFDPSEAKIIKEKQILTEGIEKISFSFDNQKIAVASEGPPGIVTIVDGSSLIEINKLFLDSQVLFVLFSSDDSYLSASTTSGNVYLYDTQTWNIISQLGANNSISSNYIPSLTFDSINTHLFFADYDGKIGQLDLPTLEVKKEIFTQSSIENVALINDLEILITTTGNWVSPKIQARIIPEGNLLGEISIVEAENIRELSTDGKSLIAVASHDGIIRIYKLIIK